MIEFYKATESGEWRPWPAGHDRFIPHNLDEIAKGKCYDDTVRVHGIWVHTFRTYLRTYWSPAEGWHTPGTKKENPGEAPIAGASEQAIF